MVTLEELLSDPSDLSTKVLELTAEPTAPVHTTPVRTQQPDTIHMGNKGGQAETSQAQTLTG